MKHTSSLVLVLSLVTTSAFSQQSPKSALTARGGFVTIQGETTSKKLFNSSGPQIGLLYSYSLRNEQWALTAEVAQSMVNVDLSSADPTPQSNLQTQVNQTYFGVGMRYILRHSINEYEPYLGQFLPYIGLGFGCIKTTNDLEIDSQQLGGYSLNQPRTFGFAGSAELGFMLVLNKHWAIDAYAGGRTSQTDNWDALAGSGKGDDWLIHGGLGLQYHF